MTEQAKVPAIRFAGFTDPWEQRKLGELEKDATLYMGRGRVISAKDMSNTPGTFPVYSSSALDNGRMGAYGKYMFNQELITWSIDGGGAVFYRRKHRFSVTNVSGYIAVNPEKINCKFLAYAMSLAHSRIKFDYTVKAHPSVIRSLYTMGIPISLQEQQVIGSFFSRLDNLITLHQRKYDKLVIFKKSMLEKMFPKDGESVPEIRFAGFTDPWEQRKLGELVVIERGGSPRPIDEYITDDTNGLNWIKIGDAPSLGRYISKTSEKIKPEGLSKTRQVHPGDLILSNSMSFGRPYIMAIEGCIHDGWLLIRDEPKSFDPMYLCHMLGTPKMLNQYRMLASGSTVNNLNKELVSNASILMPCKSEQKVIGQFFNHLDDLITLHQRKLELLQNIKKSLLDKMFV